MPQILFHTESQVCLPSMTVRRGSSVVDRETDDRKVPVSRFEFTDESSL